MKIQSPTRITFALLESLVMLAGSAAIAPTIASAQERGSAVADQQLRHKVEDALHSDPFFYDAHVNVSVQNGAVVLEGFVFSDWDLRDAIRIATKAAGGVPVVDNLTIEVGGRK